MFNFWGSFLQKPKKKIFWESKNVPTVVLNKNFKFNFLRLFFNVKGSFIPNFTKKY